MNLTEQLQTTITDQVTDLIANNAVDIANELTESDDGKMRVSIGVALVLSSPKLAVTSKLAYSLKFTSQAESLVEFDDPRQGKLEVDE